jgi:hypothetical protein
MKLQARSLFVAIATTSAFVCATFSMVLDLHVTMIGRLNSADTKDLSAVTIPKGANPKLFGRLKAVKIT